MEGALLQQCSQARGSAWGHGGMPQHPAMQEPVLDLCCLLHRAQATSPASNRSASAQPRATSPVRASAMLQHHVPRATQAAHVFAIGAARPTQRPGACHWRPAGTSSTNLLARSTTLLLARAAPLWYPFIDDAQQYTGCPSCG
jgi:hypothetical protein